MASSAETNRRSSERARTRSRLLGTVVLDPAKLVLTQRRGRRVSRSRIAPPAQRPNPMQTGTVVPVSFPDSDAIPDAAPMERLAEAEKCREVLRGGSHSSFRARSLSETPADPREFHTESLRRRTNRCDDRFPHRVPAPVTYSRRFRPPAPVQI